MKSTSPVTALASTLLALASHPALAAGEGYLLITPQRVSVTEGGATATYSVKPGIQPSAPIVVTISLGEDEEDPVLGPEALIRVAGTNDEFVAELTVEFTPANYAARVIEVRATEDDDAEGQHTETIAHAVSDKPDDAAFDSAYFYPARAEESVAVTIFDNDPKTIGVAIVESGGATQVVEGDTPDAEPPSGSGEVTPPDEGGDSYTINLTSEPLLPVTVTLEADPPGQVTLTPTSVTFDAASWDPAAPQTIRVHAVDDDAEEATPQSVWIRHTVSTTDGDYAGVTAPGVTAFVTDNDTPAVAVIESGGWTQVVARGSTDSYTLALTQRPFEPVTVDVFAGPGVCLKTGTGCGGEQSLSFDSVNWDEPQAITVEAIDDGSAIREATRTFHSARSADSRYRDMNIRDVTVCRGGCELPKSASSPEGAGGGGGGGGLGWLTLAALLGFGLRRAGTALRRG